MSPPRSEEESLSCDEHACDWDTRAGGGLGCSPSGVAGSPAPRPYDDESDGDAASQSDEDEAPPDAEHWQAALEGERALLPDASYPGQLQPVVDARAREQTVDWLLAVRARLGCGAARRGARDHGRLCAAGAR
jgi:hypothetical protein